MKPQATKNKENWNSWRNIIVSKITMKNNYKTEHGEPKLILLRIIIICQRQLQHWPWFPHFYAICQTHDQEEAGK